MPHEIYVTIDTSDVFVRIVDGIDPSTQQPFLYTNYMTEEDQVQRVDNRLTHYLDDNNVKRTYSDASAEYSVTVNEIYISEATYRDEYLDTCWGWFAQDIEMSRLQYVVNVTLKNLKTGVTFENIHLNEMYRERLREEEGCGAYEIREISMSGLHNSLAKCLRKEITKIIYEDQGF